MNRDALVHAGQRPWLPAAEAVEVAVLHYWDRPLIGVYTTDGQHVAYVCVFGEADAHAMWVYLPLSEAQVAEFAEADLQNPSAMFEWLDARSRGANVVVASSTEDAISEWTSIEASGHGGLLSAAHRFVQMQSALYEKHDSVLARLADDQADDGELLNA